MTIQVDTREKQKAITKILAEFERQGVKSFSSKLFVGDYMNLDNPRVVIDRKQNLNELACNVSTVPKKDKSGRIKRDKNGKIMTELDRFMDTIIRARDNGIDMIFLCEHGGQISCLDDVPKWKNPRVKESPLAMDGPRLYTILKRLSDKDGYGVKFEFCSKQQTGKRIIELLAR